jgi:two-component system, NtrC family, sensor kinase
MPTLPPPADPAAKPSIPRASVGPVASACSKQDGRARILVVDDEPVMGTVLRRIFGALYDVTVVDHAKAALAMFDGGADFDLVLCDVVMPDLNGPQLFEAVRTRHPRLVDRFVFITGGALQEKSSLFLSSIANPVLQKPFELGPLRELVRRVLTRTH